MLGIRLQPEDEAALERHARALGRPKSAVARDWIRERLGTETIAAQLRVSSRFLANFANGEELTDIDRATDDWLSMLDQEDGGYDWGPAGPPA